MKSLFYCQAALMTGEHCLCIVIDGTAHSTELGQTIFVFVLTVTVDIIYVIILYLIYMKHEAEKKRA
jgi:hypothetical protein